MDTKDRNPELAPTEFTSSEALAATTMNPPPSLETLELSSNGTVVAGDNGIDLAVGAEPEGEKRERPATPLQDSLRRLRRDLRAMISLGVVLFFVAIAFIGPVLYQHVGGNIISTTGAGAVGPDKYHNFGWQELGSTDQLPTAQNWLGTDNLGRDELARLMRGVVISIVVALSVEVIDIVLGVIVGVVAGYYGGLVDQFLARFTDLMFAFPGLLFAILLTGIFGTAANDFVEQHIPLIGPALSANGEARLFFVSIALSITVWPLMARYVRGQTLQLKEQQFVEAARTSGTSGAGIIMRHIVPNLFSIVIIASTLNIAGTIIGEAGLSFLGLGVQFPGSSLGLMISDGEEFLQSSPYELLLPCVVLAIIVVAFSFLGDGLRDAFDPRSKD